MIPGQRTMIPHAMPSGPRKTKQNYTTTDPWLVETMDAELQMQGAHCKVILRYSTDGGGRVHAPSPRVVQGSSTVFGNNFKLTEKLQGKEEYTRVYTDCHHCVPFALFMFFHTPILSYTHMHTHVFFFPNHLRLVAYIMALYP